MFKWIKKLFKKEKEKEIRYCVDCEHCELDASFSDLIRKIRFAKCKAPQNIDHSESSKKALKLVADGQLSDEEISSIIGVRYDVEYCTTNRKYCGCGCGLKGCWYKLKEAKDATNNSIS